MAETVKRTPDPIIEWIDARFARAGAWKDLLQAMKTAAIGIGERPCFCYDPTSSKPQCQRCETLERAYQELTHQYPCLICSVYVEPAEGHKCPRCGMRLPEEIEQRLYRNEDVHLGPQNVKFFPPEGS